METVGPIKNYFMLKASLYSDNIGLFYDILSIDIPIACKKPTRFKWTQLTWNGENVYPCENSISEKWLLNRTGVAVGKY